MAVLAASLVLLNVAMAPRPTSIHSLASASPGRSPDGVAASAFATGQRHADIGSSSAGSANVEQPFVERRPAAAAAPPTPAGQPPRSEDIPGEWIVQLNPGEAAEGVADEHARTEGAEVHSVYTAALRGYSASMSDEEAESVATDPRVSSVTRDRMVHATAQTLPPGIARVAAPSSGVGVDVDVDVAVVDSGISPHPDLNIAGGKNCNGTSTSYADGNGHGTHVAGTIAAKNDADGVVGVAPGARLWAARVLGNTGSGSDSQVICGLDWVRAQGNIEVVNMSLGGSGTEGTSCSSSAFRTAVCSLKAAGVTIVVSAGNDDRDAAGSVPATYPEVVTVSALADFDGLPGGLAPSKCSETDDTFAYFSNWGSDVDVIAPGVCVYSTSNTGGFTTMSGTSMASPHVAGAAAVYKAVNPGATPDQVRQFLIDSGSPDWSNSDDGDAIKEPLVQAGLPSPAPPTPNFTSSCSGLTCHFTDTSTATNGDPISSWRWSFGSGGATSAAQSPSFAYSEAGTFTVQLTVTDKDGSSSITQHVTVAPPTPPVANFSFSCNSLSCTFTDTSTSTDQDAISSWTWSFGSADATSTTQNPSFTYPSAGTYTVQLTVTDKDGPSSTSKYVTVSAAPPISLTLLVRNSSKVTLNWSGASGSRVEIWRRASGSGSFAMTRTTANDGSQNDWPGRGSWDYKICHIGGSVCSPERSATMTS